ncbi:MAG TPA: PTS transporter subunit EIIC [Symbiobacteriaceae bacterium]|nr:PTS transporter subunit EIIC [Symbiobacteriaceae bacterium]
MKGFMAWVEKYLAPIGGKLSEQRHLAAVRDGLIAITGLIIIGSFAVLINNLPIKGWGDLYVIKLIKFYDVPIWNGTMGILALLACFSIASHLAQSYKLDGTIGGTIAAAAFVCVTPEITQGAWGQPFYTATYLFSAMITALLAVEIMRWFIKNKIVIKVPDSVPPAVGRSFSAMLPALGVLITFALIRGGLHVLWTMSFNDVILKVLSPLKVLGGSIGGALVAVILVHLLWAVGAHGGTIVFTIFGPFFLEAATQNATAFAAGQAVPNTITGPFLDMFVYIGGAGATLGLAILMLTRAKSETLKAMGKIGIGPALFNINEPILFGVPMIANAVLIIPFILAPVVMCLVTYFAMASGLVAKTIAVANWASPVVMGAWVSTGDWKAIVLQLVNVIISVVIYYPFFVAFDKMKVREENERAAQLASGKKATA